MKKELIKAVYYSQGEGQGMNPVKFDLTIEEFTENIDKYESVITKGYSEVLEEKIESECWIIKGHAVFRILFSNGMEIDKHYHDGKHGKTFISNPEIATEENIKMGKKWIEKLDQKYKS